MIGLSHIPVSNFVISTLGLFDYCVTNAISSAAGA